MRSVLENYYKRLRDLESFMKDSESLEDLIRRESRRESESNVNGIFTSLSGSSTNRKIYNYSSTVISLYSIFERFLEELTMAYIDELSDNISTFSDLPERIKENHTLLSAQVLINKDIDKYKDKFTDQEIIDRVLSCVKDTSPKLNSIAYIDHKYNFRAESIPQFLAQIGITDVQKKIVDNPKFKHYVEVYRDIGKVSSFTPASLFSDLDDITERRNIIAHSWSEDILDTGIIIDRIKFFYVFGSCIFDIFEIEFSHFILPKNYRPLPTTIAVIDQRIACFEIDNITLKRGSDIILKSKKGLVRARIVNLQVNNVEYEEVVTPPAQKVGIEVSVRFGRNVTFFVPL